MSIHHQVLIGFANGDVHAMQVQEAQQASQIATEEAKSIGDLTNAGFRTLVVSIWMREETKSAGIDYAACWGEGAAQVLLHYGDRIASSHEFYQRCAAGDLVTSDLLGFCRSLKID